MKRHFTSFLTTFECRKTNYSNYLFLQLIVNGLHIRSGPSAPSRVAEVPEPQIEPSLKIQLMVVRNVQELH